ncbi:MAG: hypothetical protein Q7T57_04795 [Dehalococcoidales bacterium]|nr:hypothetical protein [Dehalococcoidales bacterium]
MSDFIAIPMLAPYLIRGSRDLIWGLESRKISRKTNSADKRLFTTRLLKQTPLPPSDAPGEILIHCITGRVL